MAGPAARGRRKKQEAPEDGPAPRVEISRLQLDKLEARGSSPPEPARNGGDDTAREHRGEPVQPRSSARRAPAAWLAALLAVAAGVAGGASWFASSKTAADLDGVVQQMALVRDALAELQPSVAALANEVAHLRASVAELEQRAPPVPLADGTGRPDYALASMGARVVGSSPTSLPLAMALLQRAARLLPSLLSPADQFLLSPGVVAGRCLPLRGSEGYVDIKLAHPIFLQAVTYEHVQRSLAHSTASPPPAALSVQATLGAAPLRRGDAPLLGTFMYSGDSLQTFAVASEAPVDHVRVGVSGGSGGAGGYVCVYRIRVHGRAA